MKLLLENWRKYLKEQEEVVLDKPILLYHGGRTHPNLRNIESFRKGARTRSRGVSGQGRAFFVFTDKERVERRLRGSAAVLDGFSGQYREFLPEEDGYPMILTFEVSELDPALWSLDTEIQQAEIVQGLMDNIELWTSQIRDEEVPPGWYKGSQKDVALLRLSDSQALNIDGEGILAIPIDWTMTRKNGEKRPTTSEMRFSTEDFTSMQSAARFNPIVRNIEEQVPEVFHQIEKEAFEAALLTPTSLKYTGEKPLPVKKIEAQVNGQWVDVTTQDPPMPGGTNETPT